MDMYHALLPVLTGLALLGIGLFGTLTRRRLDCVPTGLYIAGLGIAVFATGLGELGNARIAGVQVAACGLGIAIAQALVFLALARVVAVRHGATRTDDLEQLRG